MPLYRYKCPDCDHTEELLQKLEDEGAECKCGGAMDRALTTAGFSLKGGGWASEGYGNTHKDSIPGEDVHGGLMESAKKGGPQGVQEYQRKLAEKYGK